MDILGPATDAEVTAAFAANGLDYPPPDDVAVLVAATREIVRADPDAFGLDDQYEPRLGCATTAMLLMELHARLESSEGWAAHAGVHAIESVRHGLTGEQLAYRTIDS